MKYKNIFIKVIINLIVLFLLTLFQSDLQKLYGEKIIFIGIPVAFSIFFVLLNLKKSNFKSIFRIGIFLIIFSIIYYLFNSNQSSFNFYYFSFSLIIAMIYVSIQEKIIPSS
jgi:hypothetical protein